MKIEVKNINFHINTQPLFKQDISFVLEENDQVLLYGPSGSGKTSIFKMLSFLTTPTKGEIFYGKNKITSFENANKIRNKYLSLIPSNFSFFESLSIEDNILAGAYFAKVPSEIIKQKLEYLYDSFNFKNNKISLKNLKSKKISNLSNGQKEVIMISRAFMLESKFILADELLRSFNPEDKSDIFEIFKNTLKYFKKGLFMISHENIFKKDLSINKIFSINNQILEIKEIQ